MGKKYYYLSFQWECAGIIIHPCIRAKQTLSRGMWAWASSTGEQKRKFHKNYFRLIRVLFLFLFEEEFLTMYSSPPTYSYQGYLSILGSLICKAAKCTAEDSGLLGEAHYYMPPESTHELLIQKEGNLFNVLKLTAAEVVHFMGQCPEVVLEI